MQCNQHFVRNLSIILRLKKQIETFWFTMLFFFFSISLRTKDWIFESLEDKIIIWRICNILCIGWSWLAFLLYNCKNLLLQLSWYHTWTTIQKYSDEFPIFVVFKFLELHNSNRIINEEWTSIQCRQLSLHLWSKSPWFFFLRNHKNTLNTMHSGCLHTFFTIIWKISEKFE